MKAYGIPALTFLLAVALSFSLRPGGDILIRAQSDGTKTCVADAKVTAMRVTVKKHHFKLENQPVDASCLPEGFTVEVSDSLLFKGGGIVVRDFNNKKHTVEGEVAFTTTFHKPWKRHFDPGVYLNVQTAPMQVNRAMLDQSLQTALVNLLAPGVKVRKLETVIYPAQTANIQANGSVKCDSGGGGTFTGREVGLAVNAEGN